MKILKWYALVCTFIHPSLGTILTGCHPNDQRLFIYDRNNPPSSEVLCTQNILSEMPMMTTVYINNRSVLQGHSVVSVFDGKLFRVILYRRALYRNSKLYFRSGSMLITLNK